MFKLLIVLLAVLSHHSYGRPVDSIELSKCEMNFGLNLLNHLSDDKNNVFYSPLSISMAFGMLYSGAKGKTADEMKEVLGYNNPNLSDQQIRIEFKKLIEDMEAMDSKSYDLSVANKLVVQKHFNISQQFIDDLKTYYESGIESVDFAQKPIEVMNSINDWVSRETHDKIKRLLSEPLDPTTSLVLLNAIYFKGVFQTKFFKNQTQEEVFFNVEDTEVMAPMMRRTGRFNFTCIPEIDSKLLEIPYSGDDISLYIVLPNERQGLKEIKKSLNTWALIENSISSLSEQEVEVMVPKFKIETSYSLKSKLYEMGMKSVFSSDADLSGIDGNRDLEVSDVLHKAYIEVNEEGTEAEAVTAIVIMLKCADLPIQMFKVDHPFMFFIRNNRNGMVLFSGHINQL